MASYRAKYRATPWRKVCQNRHAGLKDWIKTDPCPLCGAKESVQHALMQCRVMPLVHDILHKYYGHVHIQTDEHIGPSE